MTFAKWMLHCKLQETFKTIQSIANIYQHKVYNIILHTTTTCKLAEYKMFIFNFPGLILK